MRAERERRGAGKSGDCFRLQASGPGFRSRLAAGRKGDDGGGSPAAFSGEWPGTAGPRKLFTSCNFPRVLLGAGWAGEPALCIPCTERPDRIACARRRDGGTRPVCAMKVNGHARLS